MAQRLVRRLCTACRTPYRPQPEELTELGLAPQAAEVRAASFYRPVGCDDCQHTGYSGRTGIYEMLQVDDDIRALVMQRKDAGAIKRAAVAAGMLTLRHDGALKTMTGETSVEEVLRVTQEDAE